MKNSKRKTDFKETGITLVALVVTIIVLLILAGVTLFLVLGNDGIFSKTATAKYVQARATIEEVIELGRGYAETYRYENQNSYLDKIAEYLNNDNALKSISSNTSATKLEDYVLLKVGDEFNYKITEDGAMFLGNKEQAEDALRPEVIDLIASNVQFSYSTSSSTKSPVTVTITVNQDFGGNTLQYRLGSSGIWQDYTEPFSVTANCVIYASLYNGKTYGNYVTGEVSCIDTIPPTSPTEVTLIDATINSLTVQAIGATDENSQIKYQYSIDNGVTWSPSGGTTINYTFSNLNDDTNYQVYARALDVVNNESEAISTQLSTKSYVASANNVRYVTISDCIAACPDSVNKSLTPTTITLLSSTSENITIPGEKYIVLNTNNKTLTGTITVNGILDVTGNGTVTSNTTTITNNRFLKIDGANVISNNTSSTGECILNEGIFLMSSGLLDSNCITLRHTQNGIYSNSTGGAIRTSLSSSTYSAIMKDNFIDQEHNDDAKIDRVKRKTQYDLGDSKFVNYPSWFDTVKINQACLFKNTNISSGTGGTAIHAKAEGNYSNYANYIGLVDSVITGNVKGVASHVVTRGTGEYTAYFWPNKEINGNKRICVWEYYSTPGNFVTKNFSTTTLNGNNCYYANFGVSSGEITKRRKLAYTFI